MRAGNRERVSGPPPRSHPLASFRRHGTPRSASRRRKDPSPTPSRAGRERPPEKGGRPPRCPPGGSPRRPRRSTRRRKRPRYAPRRGGEATWGPPTRSTTPSSATRRSDSPLRRSAPGASRCGGRTSRRWRRGGLPPGRPRAAPGPTESSSVPAVNLGTSHPIGPCRAANRASTVPFTSPGLSRRRREKTWTISIPSIFPSIPVLFPPSPFAATWNVPSPNFPSARAFQRSADPALRNSPSARKVRSGTPRTSTRGALNRPVASTFPSATRILPSASPFPSMPER